MEQFKTFGGVVTSEFWSRWANCERKYGEDIGSIRLESGIPKGGNIEFGVNSFGA